MSVPSVEIGPEYRIPRIILGCWQLSAGHSPRAISDSEVFATWDRFSKAGFDTLDCADIYLGVEELIGRYIRRRTSQGIRPKVHTKLVPDLGSLATLDRTRVRDAVESSLTRLGCERLDLLQLHWWDYQVPGFLDTAHWLQELRIEGKVRLLGVTNTDTVNLRSLLDAGVEVAANQVQYSLLDHRPSTDLAALCQERGIHLLCYGSLAGGLLAGRFRGARQRPAELENRSLIKYSMVVEESGGWSILQDLLEALTEIAEKYEVEPSTVAIRWVLDQPAVAAAIVGTRSADHLTTARRCLELDLDALDLERLATALAARRPLEGEPFALERDQESAHFALMKTNLNSQRGPSGEA